MADCNSESPEELEAREFFERGLHLKVNRVPGGDKKTPDFLVDGDPPDYVVEVKTRFDDEDYLSELESGKVAVRDRLMGHDRWASDNARKALKQFKQVDNSHERFWVLWLAVECDAARDTMFSQAIGSLYGVKQIVYFDDASASAHSQDCLYVVPGIFERWPDIDGAAVTMGNEINFCTNEFSDRATKFESSVLYRWFASRGGPITPTFLEAHSGFFAIRDKLVDRRDEKAVCQHLSEKHGLKKVCLMDFRTVSAAVVVPEEPQEPK